MRRLLIDSSHEYDQTIAELEAYWPRVRPGGLVLLHDTMWDTTDDPQRWCTELDYVGGPVARAIEAFTGAHGLTWHNRPGSYGLGVITKPEGS